MANDANNQNKDKHPILPKLKNENRRLANFSSSGIWDFRNKNALDELSDSLDVQTYATEINSIPDIWARPLLFEMALFNETHKLHRQILGEWRGLLAIFALRKMLRLEELRAVNLDLSLFDNEQVAKDPFLQFAPAAINLIPTETLASKGASWKYLYLFVFGKRAIGMTSPTTFVVTAADYHDVIKNPKVTWYVNGRLEDPVPHLSAKMKGQLAGWIDELRRFITNYPHKNSSPNEIVQKWTILRNLLGEFYEDLDAADSVELVDTPRLDIGGEKAAFFSFLNKTCLESGSDTDVLIRRSPSRTVATRKIILTDPQIAKQWHTEQNDVTVWGSTTLDIARPPHGKITNRNHLTQAAEDWRAEEFFTSKLFLLPKDSFLNAMPLNEPLNWQGEEYSPLIPLKKVIVEQFTAAEIARRVDFKPVEDGIEVSLNLTLLSTADGRERNYTAVKVYKKDESINTTLTTPVLEIFPNFTSTTWKAYYTCYSTDVLSATFDVTPFADEVEATDHIDYSTTGSGKRCFWRTETFPELLLCRASFPNPSRTGMEEVEAGVLLIRQPDRQPPNGVVATNSIYSLGIDFGASGTNVYANLNNIAAPAPVNFEKRIWTITAVSAADRVELYNYFLPDTKLEAPYLTIYHDFRNYDFNAPPGAGNRRFEALRNGHIFFFSDYEKFNARGTGMEVNLKWSNDPNKRVMIGAFLTQICLQSAAEAVCQGANRMDISYSYPAAFSKDQIRDLNQRWGTILPICQALTGLTINANYMTAQTESVASANFFMHNRVTNAVLETGAIIIDIGSSTSDISVWGKTSSDSSNDSETNTLLRQMSLLFAGDDLFLSYLYKHPEFLENVFNISSDTLVDLSQAQDRLGFNAQANALLRRFSDDIFKDLPDKSGLPAVRDLKQHLALGLSGIFYFLGLNVRHLISQKNFPAHTPNIFIGGNGSRMFHWFDAMAESYSNNSPLNHFFRRMFLSAANAPISENPQRTDPQNATTVDMNRRLSDNFRLQSSPLPKAEAAYGLVCGGLNYVIPKNTTTIIAGEKFKYQNQVHSWNRVLTEDMYSEGIEQVPDLPVLNDFLRTFNELADEEGIDETELNAAVMAQTEQRLVQTLSGFKGRAPKTIHVEPIFILALKHFLTERIR